MFEVSKDLNENINIRIRNLTQNITRCDTKPNKGIRIINKIERKYLQLDYS
jgi:hypothetical protein